MYNRVCTWAWCVTVRAFWTSTHSRSRKAAACGAQSGQPLWPPSAAKSGEFLQADAGAPKKIAISGHFVIVNWQSSSVNQNGPSTVITSVYSEVVTGSATGTVTGEQTAIVHPDGSQSV